MENNKTPIDVSLCFRRLQWDLAACMLSSTETWSLMSEREKQIADGVNRGLHHPKSNLCAFNTFVFSFLLFSGMKSYTGVVFLIQRIDKGRA